MRRIRNILLSPFTIALLVSIPVWILVPIPATKYLLQVEKTLSSGDRNTIFYHDFDKDGEIEKVNVGRPDMRSTPILVYDSKGGIFDQWNPRGLMLNQESIHFEDIDSDGIDEFIIITCYKDTAYLTCFNPLTRRQFCTEYPVTDVRYTKGKLDFGIGQISCIDCNNDGMKEILFITIIGHGLYPRKVFKYDCSNNSLLKSPDGCSAMFTARIFRNPKTQRYEFLMSNVALENCLPAVQMSDSYCWFIILDDSLNYKCPPFPVGIYPSGFVMDYIPDDGEGSIVGYYSYNGIEDDSSWLAVYDLEGNLLNKAAIATTKSFDVRHLWSQSDQSIVIPKADTAILYTSDLKEKGRVQTGLPTVIEGLSEYCDVNNDDIGEYIAFSKEDNRLRLFNEEMSLLAISKPVEVEGSSVAFSLYEDPDGNHCIYMDGYSLDYLLHVEENLLYKLRFAYYPLSYGIILVIILVLFALQEIRSRKRYELEKRLSLLNIKSAQNQIEPHFTLNLIESISHLIETNRRPEAINLFSGFSRFLRDTLVNFDKVGVTLEEELDYNRGYLVLQQHRLGNSFDFKIEIQDEINLKQVIPKMLVHTFVENAIKHGIRHKKERSLLRIVVSMRGKVTQIQVIDDGIGRKKAAEYAGKSTHKGIQLLDQIIESFRTEHKRRISYEIIDLTDPGGTQVNITISGE